MRNSTFKWTVTVLALVTPGIAIAQQIPTVIAALALSPILVMLIAVVLGVVSRSWLIGARHAGWVVIWIMLFGIAAYWVENDYVIWTPLALYVGHAIVMVVLIVRRMLQRGRPADK